MSESEKLIRSKIERDLQTGAMQFFDRHPELRISRCDANVNLLASAIADSSGYADPDAWDAAYAKVRQSLAPLEKKSLPIAHEPQIEPWPYKFPDFRGKDGKPDYRMLMRLTPGRMYTDFYNDKRGGELTQSALDFRRLAQESIDLENERRQS